MNRLLNLCIIILLSGSVNAQPWFPESDDVFTRTEIPRIDIIINPDTLQWIYDNVDSEAEFHAIFKFTSQGLTDTFNDVGFRLRGNTSRYSAKKSFKISFNTFIPGGKYKGLEKMNLNGEHNDPSVIRSLLAWDTFAFLKVPSSRSNHVNVYINNQYYGLYINVEHVDEEFIKLRYDNSIGNLYKCIYPASMVYLGPNKEDYKNNGYELKTNTDKDDYSDLINLIKKLNNTSATQLPIYFEPIFNVNGFLRYLAVEALTGHWDGYSVNKNNYYLFNNVYTGKFEFMPYDVDNTYGIDWFNKDWATRNIYAWWAEWEDRPLASTIMENQTYIDRYSFFINQLLEQYVDNSLYLLGIDSIKNEIGSWAAIDPYRPLDYGWTYDDFLRSYNEKLGGHVKYGLKPFITQRISSIKTQIKLNPIAPIIENIYHNFPEQDTPVTIKADIIDDKPGFTAALYYRTDGVNWQSAAMQPAADDVFNVVIPALGVNGIVEYYIQATDSDNKTSRDPYQGNYRISIGTSLADLVINEFMASNKNTIVDNYGQVEDWIEIYNQGSEPVSLNGKYLTDDFANKAKWGLPNVTLQPGEYYLVWADDDTKQGDNHANFKLSINGEQIGLFDDFSTNYAVIDTLVFGLQAEDYSFGRNVEGKIEIQPFITPMGINGDNNLAYITFTYNMKQQIALGKFVKDVDFIDIAGTFNNWQGSFPIFDGNNDGLHTATLFGFSKDDLIEYKARMKAIWQDCEFYDQGGDGNRLYTLNSGANVLNHWYNDEVLAIAENFTDQPFQIYPNPAHLSPINIVCSTNIISAAVYNNSGVLVNLAFPDKVTSYQLQPIDKPGMYFVKVETINGIRVQKLVVY